MELRVGVKAFLRSPQGKYLVLLRSPIKYPETKKWDLPGGRINPGTTLMQNLEREIMEETGLTMTSEPKLIAAQDILKISGKHVVRLTYTGTAEGEPRLSDEHIDFKWVTLDELRTIDNLDSYAKALLGLIS